MNRKASRKASERLHRPQLGPVRSDAVRRIDAQERRDQLKKTLLWGGVIAGGVVWLAWPEDETGTVLRSRSACASVTRVSQAECEAGYDRALADHERLAPRFDSPEQCRQQFITCDPDPGNAMYWMPGFAGFLLGYREHDDDDAGGGSASGYRYVGSLPLYRDRAGDYLNPRGDYVGSGVGRVTGKAGSTAAPARAITISRSGFGSSFGARSSFGG